MIELLKAHQFTVRRLNQPRYNPQTGLPAVQSYDEYNTFGNIQPITGVELDQLPEADRQRGAYYIYTNFCLRINDVVIVGPHKYEVQEVEFWNQPLALTHFRGRMVKKND